MTLAFVRDNSYVSTCFDNNRESIFWNIISSYAFVFPRSCMHSIYALTKSFKFSWHLNVHVKLNTLPNKFEIWHNKTNGLKWWFCLIFDARTRFCPLSRCGFSFRLSTDDKDSNFPNHINRNRRLWNLNANCNLFLNAWNTYFLIGRCIVSTKTLGAELFSIAIYVLYHAIILLVCLFSQFILSLDVFCCIVNFLLYCCKNVCNNTIITIDVSSQIN